MFIPKVKSIVPTSNKWPLDWFQPVQMPKFPSIPKWWIQPSTPKNLNLGKKIKWVKNPYSKSIYS